ncbi:MAG: chromate transporter [Thomasclavelia sp.]|uniref:chromate transporter n=1 Tax=Thomasclavelia sp. TaxID=3025757 RepID=UPI0039A3B958
MLNLFFIFFKIGLFSIGGGYAIIPLIQEQVVNNYHWISTNTFTDIITISQMTPGPLAVNTSTFVGIQLAGINGAIVATIGCILAGATISIILYLLFTKYQNLEIITNILNTLKATSVGLIMSAGATILMLTFYENNIVNYAGIIIFFISLFWLQKKKPNPIVLMIITGFIGFLIY